MSRGDGPAFPVPAYEDVRGEHIAAEPGMTLRQHYAGLVLQGYLAGRVPGAGDYRPHEVARACWDYADALLAAELR